jgi:broad specificity phosphatase PhoE
MERIEMTPMRPTSRALLLTGLAFLLTACSADVSGTVYVTSRSGDVRRGADVPVLLVGEQFMGEWREASATFKASYRQAAVAYLEARTRLHRGHDDYVRSRTGYRVGGGRSYEEASERLREAAARVEAVKNEWSEHTASLARRATIRSSRTDVNGRYEFPPACPAASISSWPTTRFRPTSSSGSFRSRFAAHSRSTSPVATGATRST